MENGAKMKRLLGTCIVSAVLSVLDMAADLYLAWQYHQSQEILLMGLTLGVMMFSSLVTTARSVSYYKKFREKDLRSGFEQALVSESCSKWLVRLAIFLTHSATLASLLVAIHAAARSLSWRPAKKDERRGERRIYSPRVVSPCQASVLDPAEDAADSALMTPGDAPSPGMSPDTSGEKLMDTSPERVRPAVGWSPEDWGHVARRARREANREKLSECLSENVPQLVLQIAVMLRTTPAIIGGTGLGLSQLLAVLTAGVSMVFHLFSYLRRATLSEPSPACSSRASRSVRCGHLTLGCLPLLGVLVSRVLLLSAVGSLSFYWIVGTVLIHLVVMFGITELLPLPCPTCTEHCRSERCRDGRCHTERCHYVLKLARVWAFCWLLLPDSRCRYDKKFYYFGYGVYVLEAIALISIYFYEEFASNLFSGWMLLTPGALACYLLMFGVVVHVAYVNLLPCLSTGPQQDVEVCCTERPQPAEQDGETTPEQDPFLSTSGGNEARGTVLYSKSGKEVSLPLDHVDAAPSVEPEVHVTLSTVQEQAGPSRGRAESLSRSNTC